jgi:hypothetical protein
MQPLPNNRRFLPFLIIPQLLKSHRVPTLHPPFTLNLVFLGGEDVRFLSPHIQTLLLLEVADVETIPLPLP